MNMYNTTALTYFPTGEAYEIWYREQLGFRLGVTLFNLYQGNKRHTHSTYSMIYTHVLQLDNKRCLLTLNSLFMDSATFSRA